MTKDEARQLERDQAWLDELRRADQWVDACERINRGVTSDYGPARLDAAKIAQKAVRDAIARQQKARAAACAD